MKCAVILAALILVAPVLLFLLAQDTAARAAGRVVEGGPDPLSHTRSLAQAIDAAQANGRRLHILFVHGIRAEGSGASDLFVDRLAKAIHGKTDAPQRIELTLSDWPQAATMSGMPEANSAADRTQIWRSADEWKRSQPFLNRRSIATDRGTVLIDEVDYWPLLFPLKCRFLLVPEHDLSGNDMAHLELCAAQGWLSDAALKTLQTSHPRSGGGALVNRKLKQGLMNWGLADAVIALGPMKRYFNDMIDLACEKAIEVGPDDRYVIVSESLGSFVVLDAFAERRRSVTAVLDRTADLYFFANQFALLELARIDGIPPSSHIAPSAVGQPARPAAGVAPASPLGALSDWAHKPSAQLVSATAGLEKQIIAFSDPSDILSFNVPRLKDVTVVNLYDRQGFNLFGLLADPVAAHTGHAGNEAVWKILLRR